ncbi:hypothetical protein IW139_001324 [Coemansia sp. RSA 353]|nr:hypothetical protein IW139_001324 [Coemansia sp. RSA 353]
MVQLQAFGSTSKYCFICAGRDRRHLSNTRILGRHGISHPGLTWRYSEEQEVMTCLGYSCRIYRKFDLADLNCCLSVHRSCYTLLLDHLERSEGSGAMCELMQRVLPFIDSRGVLSANFIHNKRRQQWQKRRTTCSNTSDAWLMCDPTDLPAVSTLEDKYFSGGYEPHSLALLVPSSGFQFGGDTGQMCFEDSMGIPAQLLTPPMSPVEEVEETFMDQPDKESSIVPHRRNLAMLPPHILLSIVSYLHSPGIAALSQTCSIFRIYLAPTSPVWAQVCRLAFSYTPKYQNNQQIAEYYLRVRGNSRLESRVLVQRERIERIIRSIVHLQPAC